MFGLKHQKPVAENTATRHDRLHNGLSAQLRLLREKVAELEHTVALHERKLRNEAVRTSKERKAEGQLGLVAQGDGNKQRMVAGDRLG